MPDADLTFAVRTIVERCLAVQAGEEVLVVADPDRQDIGAALLAAAREAGADAVLAILPPLAARGTEPPRTIAAAFGACDVFIAPSLPSLSHTKARKAATEQGARGATLPGVTKDLLARLMSTDFDAMAKRCRAVADVLTEGDEAHITCPHGTDLYVDLRERAAIADDGTLTAPGAFGNLPCGEGFVSPRWGEGRAVVHTAGMVGLLREPVAITVADGKIADASGEQGTEWIAKLTAHGELGRNFAELGVGTNERATLTGNVLEDEKMLGTVHIAFGASQGIGGNVSVPVHDDAVILEPTLTVGGTTVVTEGRFLL